ncbi:TfoX/Sxy family DNA transformation protein [Photobacterium angustum]|uniref:TfoX/Sxy family DNA transformation protein n=1 Tax=Photobacterium angustum TaxID=661 RepID=UPI0005DC2C12|nr:TfoX/Sxy family DNA transformation protein [Photobacterium angustum]KJG18361.1 DNA transformation protein [Photobacterium angustum]KJG26452.1 DNA transformation protein [Photobacterium angustum]KJG29234.1 DNA transformation protein [Photobacterium angustum]PSW95307.1 DNA transformation protein [Photobacterium angustum]PSX04121.1 DNA transformation protein [Photobacterium angustum]
MTSPKEDYLNYLNKFGEQEKRSMFGGTGVFIDGAMFAIVTPASMYIRGGEKLDPELIKLGCTKFKHIKKSKTATVNYYEIRDLLEKDPQVCNQLVAKSIEFSCKDKAFKQSGANKRLRDLPNMRLTLERMVKRTGVLDVPTFLELGAVNVYRKVCEHHGEEVNRNLLWIFAGAVKGCHWQLLTDEYKSGLLEQYHSTTN